MSENFLLKQVLDKFIQTLEKESDISPEIVEGFKSLRERKKLTKGNNLKEFLLNLKEIDQENNES